MRAILLVVASIWPFCVTTASAEGVLQSVERRIGKEPSYDEQPRYLLLALGPEAKTLVWVVEDGRKLYVDKNANGDLTDDGSPILPSNQRSLGRSVESIATRDFNYVLAAFTPQARPTQKDFSLSRWNYGESTADSYGLSFTLDGTTPMYAGWFGSFWGKSPGDASIVHFGAPLTPRLLRYKEFALASGERRLSLAFMNRGLGEGADARLSIDGPAADVVPVLHIVWPTADPAQPLETVHRLRERCCYWEFYTTDFKVPSEAAVGTATVTIKLPAGALPLPLTSTEIKVPVVAAPVKGQSVP